MNDGVWGMFSLERVCGVLGGEGAAVSWVGHGNMLSTQNGSYITFPYYEQTLYNFVLAPRRSVECVEHE